jgi:hypothetical protein
MAGRQGWRRGDGVYSGVQPRRCYLPNSVTDAGGQPQKFPSNLIRTAKYGRAITFLPHALFVQLCRAANLYFLAVSILQLAANITSDTYSTLIPLMAVISISVLREVTLLSCCRGDARRSAAVLQRCPPLPAAAALSTRAVR